MEVVPANTMVFHCFWGLLYLVTVIQIGTFLMKGVLDFQAQRPWAQVWVQMGAWVQAGAMVRAGAMVQARAQAWVQPWFLGPQGQVEGKARARAQVRPIAKARARMQLKAQTQAQVRVRT